MGLALLSFALSIVLILIAPHVGEPAVFWILIVLICVLCCAGLFLSFPRIKKNRPQEALAVTALLLFALWLGIWFSPSGVAPSKHPKTRPATEVPWKHGAKLEWGPFSAVSQPNGNTPFFFNVYMPNNGQLDAINVRRAYAWRITQEKGEALSSAEIDEGMSIARSGLIYPVSAELSDRVAAGDGKTWFTVSDKFLTPANFENVVLGDQRLYLWGILEYRDTDSEAGQAIFTEFCAYWEGSFAFYHYCDKYNAIYRGPLITALH